MERRKKLILIAGIIGLVVLVVVYFFQSTRKASPTTNLPYGNNNLSTIPTIAAPYDNTGGQKEGFEALAEKRPEYKIEAKLRGQMPISGDGFSITFDYSQNKFIVSIAKEYVPHEKSFREWAKSQNLNDLTNFIVQYK